MVEIFADEGISGMKAKNRPEFQRMIRMCELHQLDLIITKSVSRFARNVKEALEYVRKLKLLGVGTIFEKEGINTQSLGDEMLLNTNTIKASNHEFTAILSDCSDYEMRVLLDIVKATKQAMREYKYLTRANRR